MHVDFGFLDSSVIDIEDHLPSHPDESLLPVIAAFRANNERWRSHSHLAGYASICGMRFEECLRYVLWAKLGQPFLGDNDVGDLAEDLKAEIEHGTHFYGDTSRELLLDPKLVFHPRNVEIDGLTGNPIDRCIQVMFESQAVDAWTMFETLAGDLWVDAVNECPDPLAGLKGSPSRITDAALSKDGAPQIHDAYESEEEDREFVVLSSKKTVGLQHLHNITHGSFNLSKEMGHVHVMSERVKFTSLEHIREAYSMAFPEKYKKAKPTGIDRPLSNMSLDGLALVRNAIVHRAGKADRWYVNEQKRINTAPKREENDDINLSFHETSVLVNAVVQCSVLLINGVNEWLKLTKQRKTNS